MFDIDYLTDSLNYTRVSSTNLTAGKEEADRLGLAFPSLNPILGVGTASISSSVSADRHSSAAGKSHVSAGRPTGSAGRPVSAGKPTGSAGRPISAGKPTGSAGRPTGSAGRPVSAGRLSVPAGRSYVPAGRILGKIFDCLKSGIFTFSSYDEDFSGPDANNLESSLNVSSTITKRIHNIHPTSQLIGDINSPVHTRSQVKHKEMQQFMNQKVWVLVTLPDGKRAIGAKWILKNKRDARARIEAIQLFLAFASFIRFMVYQMDVKSSFLYGKIAEEVYVTQPRVFEDPDHPKKVYKVVKALYGLHQAPRA
nr:hypothetical protein [Tanacetum cinerariifolium]